jgi:hypothetical protein
LLVCFAPSRPLADPWNVRKVRFWTASSFGYATHVWNDYVTADPKVAPLAHRPRMVAVGGGYPILEDGKLIGGIGISGATISRIRTLPSSPSASWVLKWPKRSAFSAISFGHPPARDRAKIDADRGRRFGLIGCTKHGLPPGSFLATSLCHGAGRYPLAMGSSRQTAAAASETATCCASCSRRRFGAAWQKASRPMPA